VEKTPKIRRINGKKVHRWIEPPHGIDGISMQLMVFLSIFSAEFSRNIQIFGGFKDFLNISSP